MDYLCNQAKIQEIRKQIDLDKICQFQSGTGWKRVRDLPAFPCTRRTM